MSQPDPLVQPSRPPRVVIATSQEIRDRRSIFLGSVYRATNGDDAKAAAHYHKHVVHAGKKVYEIFAWRCMVVKSGRTGLGGPDDFELREGYEDDGEQWAGSKVLKVMQTQGVIDAAVIVSRWFGGTLLGPIRFQYIETCASEACRKFQKLEEMEECLQTLTILDGQLLTLRKELDTLKSSSTLQGLSKAENNDEAPSMRKERLLINKQHDYSAMRGILDLAKARRIIHARESAIKSVQTLIAKCKDVG